MVVSFAGCRRNPYVVFRYIEESERRKFFFSPSVCKSNNLTYVISQRGRTLLVFQKLVARVLVPKIIANAVACFVLVENFKTKFEITTENFV